MSKFSSLILSVNLAIWSLSVNYAYGQNVQLPLQDISKQDVLKIAYPPVKNEINASSTFIVGQLAAGNSLFCNGQEIKVNLAGFFAHVVPLQFGANSFVLTCTNTANQQTISKEITIYRKAPRKAIAPDEIKLEDASPSTDLGVKAGDTIYFSVHATPNSTVTVSLDQKIIRLTPAAARLPVSEAVEVAYGKVAQQPQPNKSIKALAASDLYKGSYHVSADDRFISAQPKFELIHGNQHTTLIAKAKISTIVGLLPATTNKVSTIVRLGPGLARTTPLVEGIKICIDGWSGDNMRCLYSPNRHVWIKQSDLNLEKPLLNFAMESTAIGSQRPYYVLAPHTVARTINIISDEYGERICLPFTEKVPYQIEQKLDPNNLILRIYGVSADTDWITTEPKINGDDTSFIDHVSWRQVEDNVYDMTVHLSGRRQWGYRAFYEGDTLCLAIKRPINSKSLTGVKICVDPGHGGQERGSIGCSGLPESQINLDIATKLKSCLEEQGANVIMTRTTQNENPSLDNRVKIATDAQADFLISIHNNALPDGRDPWREHGTSSYWYHPQSVELARCLKDSVKAASGFIDLGSRYQNLALARAQAMPSVLLEIGFMINPDEFSQLIDQQFQEKIARAIAAGLHKYLQNGP